LAGKDQQWPRRSSPWRLRLIPCAAFGVFALAARCQVDWTGKWEADECDVASALIRVVAELRRRLRMLCSQSGSAKRARSLSRPSACVRSWLTSSSSCRSDRGRAGAGSTAFTLLTNWSFARTHRAGRESFYVSPFSLICRRTCHARQTDENLPARGHEWLPRDGEVSSRTVTAGRGRMHARDPSFWSAPPRVPLLAAERVTDVL
jgi:hypothetical protein